MKIRKPERVDVVPAIPGVAARAAMVLCPSTPPDASPNPGRGAGGYVTLCVVPTVYIDGIPLSLGHPLCTTVWSPSGG